MKYALGNMLNGIGVTGLDPNAKSYIDSVIAAGATVTATQRNAINAFVKSEKADSRWTMQKRLYLPIWGVAPPNAIDMVGLTSGSFVGGETHTAGYVTSNGTSGHFLSDVSPGGAGCTLNGTGVHALYTAAASLSLTDSIRFFGANTISALTRTSVGGRGATTRFLTIGPNSNGFFTPFALGDQRGVQFLGRGSSISRFFLLRTSALLTDSQTDASVTLNSTIPMCWLANNNNGTIGSYVTSVARLGAAGMTEGMSQANAEAFTVNLKTLWETCTGLTLP